MIWGNTREFRNEYGPCVESNKLQCVNSLRGKIESLTAIGENKNLNKTKASMGSLWSELSHDQKIENKLWTFFALFNRYMFN